MIIDRSVKGWSSWSWGVEAEGKVVTVEAFGSRKARFSLVWRLLVAGR